MQKEKIRKKVKEINIYKEVRNYIYLNLSKFGGKTSLKLINEVNSLIKNHEVNEMVRDLILKRLNKFLKRYISYTLKCGINEAQYKLKLINSFEEMDDFIRVYMENTLPKNACIYFIQNQYNNRIKIGMTTKGVETRLSQLEGNFKLLGMTPKLKLIGILPIHKEYALKVEKDLHDLFKEKRCIGEWFDITESDIDTYLLNDFEYFSGIKTYTTNPYTEISGKYFNLNVLYKLYNGQEGEKFKLFSNSYGCPVDVREQKLIALKNKLKVVKDMFNYCIENNLNPTIAKHGEIITLSLNKEKIRIITD